jgi:hypothetical protein
MNQLAVYLQPAIAHVTRKSKHDPIQKRSRAGSVAGPDWRAELCDRFCENRANTRAEAAVDFDEWKISRVSAPRRPLVVCRLAGKA